MVGRRKQKWDIGDVFIIPQKDGMCSLGQILEAVCIPPTSTMTRPNVVTCSFYDIRCTPDFLDVRLPLPFDKLISSLSVPRWSLDSGAWKIIVRGQPVTLEKKYWANEQFRQRDWVGSRQHDPGVAEGFLNAFYGLEPWDDYYDPNYLDSLLISPDKKPKHVMLKKQAQS
jgi:hypothetical protein